MKLDIVYAKDRQVKVQDVWYIAVLHGTLYCFLSDGRSVRVVDLKDVAAFSIE